MKTRVKKNTCFLIVPCFNEEEIIEKSISKLTKKIKIFIKNKKISNDSKIILVNDGSTDNTWDIISKISLSNPFLIALKFSKNFGHQNAVLAGLEFSVDKCDYTISIDADLQQDINAIDRFIDKFNEGNDLVYGIRNSRNTDSFFKKITSQLFYKLMIKMVGGDTIILNHADYRLVSNKVLNILKYYKEHDIFLRGLFPSMGFKHDFVYFDVFDRSAGSSKYTFKKMFNLALNGITSFSIFPLELILIVGFLLLMISVGMIISFAFFNNSFILYFGAMLFSASIIILCMGIIGLYLGKIHLELKGRPRYIVETTITGKNR